MRRFITSVSVWCVQQFRSLLCWISANAVIGRLREGAMESDAPVRLQRKHSVKRWSDVFFNNVQMKLDKRDRMIQQRREERLLMYGDQSDQDDESSVYTLATLTVRTKPNQAFLTSGKLVKKSDGRKKTAAVAPMEERPKLPEWKSHWGSQLLCYLCSKPSLHDSISCSSCNNIAHKLCVVHLLPSFPDAARTCMECLEQHYSNINDYNERMRRLKETMLRSFSATIITRRAHVFLERRKLQRKKIAIVVIQTALRRCIYQRRYRQQQRHRLRLLLCQFSVHITGNAQQLNQELLAQTVVVITVIDTHRNVQHFRMERTIEQLPATAVTLPGVNGFMSLVITLVIRDDTKAFLIVGQTQINLSDIVNPNQSREIPLSFYPKPMWIPQDNSGQTGPTHQYRHVVTVGRITHGMRTIRERLHLRMLYLPQNPVTTCCMYVSAPPLDILRRVGDSNRAKRLGATGNANTQSGHHPGTTGSAGNAAGNGSAGNSGGGTAGPYRSSRYWISLYRLRLLFYQFYGDEEPRFAADIHDGRVEILRDKGRLTSLLNLSFPDQRVWMLEFADRKAAVHFEVAVNESKKALRDNSSIYMRQDEFSADDVSIGFR